MQLSGHFYLCQQINIKFRKQTIDTKKFKYSQIIYGISNYWMQKVIDFRTERCYN